MRKLWQCRGIIIAWLICVDLWSLAASKTVTLLTAKAPAPYSDATESGAIKFACSPDAQLLEVFFFRQGLPLSRDLVRAIRGDGCHVFYRPTLPGFRASPEDDPVRGLSFSINARHMLIRPWDISGTGFGSLLSILRLATQPVPALVAVSSLAGVLHLETVIRIFEGN